MHGRRAIRPLALGLVLLLPAAALAGDRVRAMGDVGSKARASGCAELAPPCHLKEELRDRTGRRAGEAIRPAGRIEIAPRRPGEGECGRP